MKTTTVTCDNCDAVIEKATGDTYGVTVKIKGWYVPATIILHERRHLCYDCWLVVMNSSQPLEKRLDNQL